MFERYHGLIIHENGVLAGVVVCLIWAVHLSVLLLSYFWDFRDWQGRHHLSVAFLGSRCFVQRKGDKWERGGFAFVGVYLTAQGRLLHCVLLA